MSEPVPCQVLNQIYAQSIQPNPSGLQEGGIMPVTSLQGGLSFNWNFKRLDNGAFHIIPPTLDTGRNAAELRAVGKDDLLFVKNETGSEDADPNIIQEWEVLSSARDGGAIEPLNGKFKGWYIIAARGDPKRVWMLPSGMETTQVAVRDLFTADGPDQADQQAYLNAQALPDTRASDLNWKPRQWLWYIDSNVKV
ncbi:hypothetical protein NLI96_g3963 [Meripilus lineatus]|uniref:Uncharacterized protein n=1 Tax=Meripilus lineatus TaxID=2056292 RepID=A0AAD5V5V4_9APHY|nr:hypothetical protein NLI96_g3963 [Physisporinus lineatus]